MNILILGNSNLFQRKIYHSLKKKRNIKIEVASKRKFKFKDNIIFYNSYKKAIDQTKSKIVYISLINSEHFKWAYYCLIKNKNVLIDKPFTINFKQTKKLINLARKKKLFLSEAIVFQKHRQFKKVFSLLNMKKKIHLESNFHIPKLPRNNFRNRRDLGGGCFQDMSVYGAYLILLFFGKKKLKYEKVNNNKFDQFSLLAKSKKILINCSFKFNSNYKNEIRIKNDSKLFIINYAFSPPIDKSTEVRIFDDFKKKEYKLKFNKQNTFDDYFLQVIKLIKNKKYNYFYNEIEKIAKIKKQIS